MQFKYNLLSKWCSLKWNKMDFLKKKNVIFNNVFFFFFFFFFFFLFFQLFIHLDCLNQGGRCSLEVRTVCNMDDLAYRFVSPCPSYLSPGGAWRGAAGHRSITVSICLPLCCDGRECGWEREGVRTPLVGLRIICAWDRGSHLLGAWTSRPECVTC